MTYFHRQTSHKLPMSVLLYQGVQCHTLKQYTPISSVVLELDGGVEEEMDGA